MASWRVLDRDEVIADAADVTERTHRLGGVIEQELPEGGIGPRLGDNPGAIVRADLGFVGLDNGIERSRIDIAFFGQDGFERPHAQLRLGQFRVMMIVFGHGRKDKRNVRLMSRREPVVPRARISATEAFEWGLVEEAADPGKAFDAVMTLATKMAAQPPLSVAMTKLTVNRLAHAR